MPEKTEFREPIQQVLLWNIWYDIFEFCSIENLSSDSKKKSLSRHTSPNVFQQNIHDSTSTFPPFSNNEDVCFQ